MVIFKAMKFNYRTVFSAVVFILTLGCTSTRHIMTPTAEIKTSGKLPRTDSFMRDLLAANPAYFDSLLQNNRQWRIQVIYTRIDRNAQNEPCFTNFYYGVSPDLYYYPASTVKMPVAI